MYQFLQDAGPLAVNDLQFPQVGHNGLADEALQPGHGLLAPLPAQVQTVTACTTRFVSHSGGATGWPFVIPRRFGPGQLLQRNGYSRPAHLHCDLAPVATQPHNLPPAVLGLEGHPLAGLDLSGRERRRLCLAQVGLCDLNTLLLLGYQLLGLANILPGKCRSLAPQFGNGPFQTAIHLVHQLLRLFQCVLLGPPVGHLDFLLQPSQFSFPLLQLLKAAGQLLPAVVQGGPVLPQGDQQLFQVYRRLRDQFLGAAQQLLVQPHAPGDLQGVTGPGPSLQQTVGGAQLPRIELHAGVLDSGRILGPQFQAVQMGGGQAPGP